MRLALAAVCLLLPAASLAQECIVPDVVVTLDASGSMLADTGAGTRWEVATSGIGRLAQVNTRSVRWGLVVFPGAEECDAGEALVALPSDGLEVQRALGRALPEGGTPTAPSVRVAHDVLRAGRTDKPQYHLLVTDGDANCNTALDPATCTCTCRGETCDCTNPKNCLDDVDTVAAVEALTADGVPTFVVGFGDDLSTEVLDRLAEAGGTAKASSPKFIAADDEASFLAALSSVAEGVGVATRPCTSVCGDGVERCTESGWSPCDAPVPGHTRSCITSDGATGVEQCGEDGWGPCVTGGPGPGEEDGCGCASAGPAAPLPLVLLGLWLLRRRSAAGMRPTP